MTYLIYRTLLWATTLAGIAGVLLTALFYPSLWYLPLICGVVATIAFLGGFFIPAENDPSPVATREQAENPGASRGGAQNNTPQKILLEKLSDLKEEGRDLDQKIEKQNQKIEKQNQKLLALEKSRQEINETIQKNGDDIQSLQSQLAQLLAQKDSAHPQSKLKP